jgi:hypothetical protein
MRRDAAPDTLMIGNRMPPFPKANENKNKKRRPAQEKRAHEPVAELDDVVDLVSVGGSVWRLTEKFIN